MTGLTGILASFVASHLVGMAGDGLFGRFKAFRARRLAERQERSRVELAAWLREHQNAPGAAAAVPPKK